MKGQSPLYLISGIIFLLISIYLLKDIPYLINNNVSIDNRNSEYFANSALKKIDAALNRNISIDPFVYSGSFESPFRMSGDDPSLKVKTNKLPNRPKLFLKGILQKDTPLAIIADDKGETYIRGVGEKVFDQEIIKINDSKVTLHAIGGNYDLIVEEQ
jgi:hypothetical protein